MSKMVRMNEPKHIIQQIGRSEVAARLGVTRHAISKALTRGKLPASWFIRLRDLAEVRGLTVREDWFNWAGEE